MPNAVQTILQLADEIKKAQELIDTNMAKIASLTGAAAPTSKSASRSPKKNDHEYTNAEKARVFETFLSHKQGVTAEYMAVKTGLSRKACSARLNTMFNEGKLERLKRGKFRLPAPAEPPKE